MLVGPHSTASERDAYAERLLADPANFISQPVLDLSPGELLRGRATWRPAMWMFAPSCSGGRAETYIAPGGLCRVGPAQGRTRGELEPGGRLQGPLGAARPGGAGLMLARAAADFYWMGRYFERTEHTARLLQYQLTRLVDTPADELALGWRVIYRTLGQSSPVTPTQADEAEAFPDRRRLHAGGHPGRGHTPIRTP